MVSRKEEGESAVRMMEENDERKTLRSTDKLERANDRLA